MITLKDIQTAVADMLKKTVIRLPQTKSPGLYKADIFHVRAGFHSFAGKAYESHRKR